MALLTPKDTFERNNIDVEKFKQYPISMERFYNSSSLNVKVRLISLNLLITHKQILKSTYINLSSLA